MLSRAANLVYHWGAGPPHECTTNFRVFSRRAAAAVLSRAKGNGYEFMPESTLLVVASRFMVQEIPITFTNRRLGESKLDMRQVIKGVLFCVSSIFMYRLRLGASPDPKRKTQWLTLIQLFSRLNPSVQIIEIQTAGPCFCWGSTPLEPLGG